MGDITQLLSEAARGDDSALEAVFERVYPELRRLAASRRRAAAVDGSLDPTALVHEVFLRLVGSDRLELQNRRHFFACAARAMRMVLVDHARRRSASKRGGDAERVTFTEGLGDGRGDAAEVLDLDRALDDLAEISPRGREVVDLRYFAGLTAEETAELMELSLRTVHREWKRARAFLHARMGG